jgi:hypothetical protein
VGAFGFLGKQERPDAIAVKPTHPQIMNNGQADEHPNSVEASKR